MEKHGGVRINPQNDQFWDLYDQPIVRTWNQGMLSLKEVIEIGDGTRIDVSINYLKYQEV